MANTEGKERVRAQRVTYNQFSQIALDTLLTEMNKSRDAEVAKAKVSASYPEFRSLTRAQIKRLAQMHRAYIATGNPATNVNGGGNGNGNGNGAYHSNEEELRCMAMLSFAKQRLDDSAFNRVVDFGMYLVGKG